MRRLDKLIIAELMGPWTFGVAIFTVMIMAGTILFQLTSYIVHGVPGMLILEFFLLILPGIIAKTLSMAVLLATLLAFGRLSSDSEIVAMKAGGAGIQRLMIPVILFGIGVAGLAFGIDEVIVPQTAKQGQVLKAQIEKTIRGQPQFQQVYDHDTLRAMIMAVDFNLKDRSLKGVTIDAYDKNKNITFTLHAPSMQYTDERHWKLGPGAYLDTPDGTRHINLGATYPLEQVAEPPNPFDIQASILKDLDTFSMAEMKASIEAAKKNPGFKKDQLANLEYGYYNKVALPLAAMIFALLGATLGIRSHRTGTATGFWLSVVIIFAYMFMANWMNIYAMGGIIPAYIASFAPCTIGFTVGLVLMFKKNH